MIELDSSLNVSAIEEPSTNLSNSWSDTNNNTAQEIAPHSEDFLELYLQKCSDYSIQKPCSRLIKEYSKLKEKGKRMRHLMLNGNCVSMFENRLQNLDIFAICDTLEILNTSFIVSCDLSFNNIGDSGANAIARMLKINTSIQHLSVKSNAITERGASDVAEALKENHSLKSFDFSYNSIEDKGGLKMAEMLKENSTLKFLNLNACDLKTSSITLLAIVVKAHPSLRELRIAKTIMNSKKEETVIHLSEIFKVNDRLRSLDLSFQSLSDSGVTVFFQGIMMCRTLTHLYLGANCITLSTDIIARFLENPNCALQHLDLSANRIDSDGGKQIARSLIKNKTLIHLDLTNNNIGDDVLTFLAKTLLSKNDVLKKLLIADNNFSQPSIQAFHALTKERFDIEIDIYTYKTDETYYWTRKATPVKYEHNVDTKEEQITEIEHLLVSCFSDNSNPMTNLDRIVR
ncbi:hypothetical protein C9374_007454 [Naegleria lovaniensis]|uniref:Uncharacterized protein n=1 Tax=Naegleria lovaniensis TaxID=51637 RepID=A0AA88KH89_NAELO|nr:uncharacterized protein C9374_007454 [Naegleria lovaniensis]KAG2379315.1 hypothetical protein C9374_007454 [Naegleria lovaniensis]